MALTEKLELLVSADTSRGITELQRFAGEADRSLKGAESSIARFGSAASKIGASGLGIGGLLTALGSKEQEAAGQLDAAIGQVGQSVEDYKGRIEDAESAQVRFGHTSAEVQGALATLTLSYSDTGRALDEMQLVADLAARKHVSLGEAATMVAKAHGGAARLFKEFGIQVGTNAAGTKDYDGALTQLAQKLQGQAAASADTFGGRIKALGAEVENVASSIGERYGPAILGVSALLTAAGPIVSGVAAIQGRLAASHLAVATAAEADAVATTEAAAAQALVITNSSAAVASLYAEDAALVASGSAFGVWGGLVAAGIVVASEAVDIWGAKTEHTFSKVQDYVSESAKDLASSYTELIFEGNKEDPGKFLDALVHGGEAGVGALSRLRDELRAEGYDTAQVDAALQKAKDAQDEFNKSSDAGAKVLGNQTKAMQEGSSALEGFGGLLDTLTTGMSRQYDALLSNRKAGIGYYETFDQMTKTLAENKGTLDDHTDAGRKDLNSIFATGEAIKTLITNRLQETHSIEAATTSGKLYVENLKGQLRQLGFSQSAVDSYIAEMHLTPAEIDTTFSNNAVSQTVAIQKYVAQLKDIPVEQRTAIEAQLANGQFDQVNAELNTLAAGRTVDFTLNVHGGGQITMTNSVTGEVTSEVDIAARNIGPRAMGGSGLPGQSYFIEPGTKGEVFSPSSPGWFTPMDKLGKSNTPETIVQHIYAPTDPWAQQQAAQQERAKARYLSSSGR